MTAVFKYLPRITSENGLTRYLQEIRKYPLLEPKYERDLAMKWAKKKDIESDHILVTSHLRLVAKIAMGFKGFFILISGSRDLTTDLAVGFGRENNAFGAYAMKRPTIGLKYNGFPVIRS